MNKLVKLRHLYVVHLLCLFLIPAVLSGADQQEKLTLSLKDVTVTQFFKEIENRTSYKFFYKDSQVENLPLVTLKAENLTLA